MAYLSHPDKLLKDHLREVGEAAAKYVEAAIGTKDKRGLIELARLIGLTHDFGKYTSFFQEHLKGSRNDKLSRHSLLSAVFLAHTLFQREHNKYDPLIGYLCIYSHHSNLRSVRDTLPKMVSTHISENAEMLKEQIENGLDYDSVQKELKEIGLELGNLSSSWESTIDRVHSLFHRYQKEPDSTKKDIAFTVYLLFSALIDADKKDAARVQETSRGDIPPNIVDTYAKKLEDSSPMKNTRKQVYEEVISRKFPTDTGIFSITAPTGSGKTLSALNFAVKLRSALGGKRRIIYVLPFTSIIDQNFDIISQVLSAIPDFQKNESVYLLKHHYRADVYFKGEGIEENIEKELLLVESWHSECIVTTFVQFFNSVVAYKNRYLKKLHNIAGSVILLDEVQSIPVKYWELTKNTLSTLVNEYDCRIVMLTATQPAIFSENEVLELADSRHFKEMNRVQIIADLNPIRVEELYEKFKRSYQSGKSYLLIFNTINSSIQFYEKLKRDYENTYYLSANIVPRERSVRIKRIKEALERGEKPIVVSTQVIEAGVDIDFDCVYRDIGPVDSIIQAAGRCNRNYSSKDQSTVHVFHLVNENGHTVAPMVYGGIHISISKNMLQQKPQLEERSFPELFKSYTDEVRKKMSQAESTRLWNNILNLEFEELSSFSLIEEIKDYVDVFVELDESASTIWDNYQKKVIQEKDFHERLRNYLEFRKSFRDYIVSAPKESVINFVEHSTESIVRLPRENIKDYYDEETGIRRKGGDAFWII